MSASLHQASPYNVIQLNSRHTRQEKYFVRIKNVHKIQKLFEAFILFMDSFAILDVHCLLDLMLKYWTLEEMETLFNNKYFSKSNQQFIFRITN